MGGSNGGGGMLLGIVVDCLRITDNDHANETQINEANSVNR